MNRRVLFSVLWAACAWAAATAEVPATPPPANQVEVITSGAQKWELLTADLEQARQAICVEYFTFANDSYGRIIGDILMRKAQEGIPVRMILENGRIRALRNPTTKTCRKPAWKSASSRIWTPGPGTPCPASTSGTIGRLSPSTGGSATRAE